MLPFYNQRLSWVQERSR